jgi:hypothetical protein
MHNPIKITSTEIFRALVVALMSLVLWIAQDIQSHQADILCRLRIVELNQAKILGTLGVKPVSSVDELKQYVSEFQ